jgi:hypothetical protein
MMDSTENEILFLLIVETGTLLLLGKIGDGGLEGVEVTSTSTSESSESKIFVSVLTTRGSGQSE